MQAIKRIGGILLDILIALVIILGIITTIISITSNEDGIPNVFGYSPFSIQTNSMAPSLKSGDLIIVKSVDPATLKVGDIISYYDTIDGENVIKTHRIVNIFDDGVRLYTTRGDNNDVDDDYVLTEVDIIGKYQSIRIPLLGYIIDFFKSKWGFLLFIVVPLAIIFIVQLISLIRLIVEELPENDD